MSEITKLYENAGIKPEYRYDCNLADTIKPLEVFPLCSCSKGEIKDYCTNKQDYRYCKVYKVNKIYPPFTAEKQIEIVKFLLTKDVFKCYQHYTSKAYIVLTDDVKDFICNKPFDEFLASYINYLWLSLTEEEKQQVKGILE